MRAVIFDFDGVLVDSEAGHYRAIRAALAEHGVFIDEAEYRDHLLAYDDRSAVRRAYERRGTAASRERVAAIAERKAEIYRDGVDDIAWLPGSRDLVGRLACPVAIASGALRAEIFHALDSAGLRERFAAIVGADDVRQTKPHPEPYLSACAALSRAAGGALDPSDCLVFEDSPAGIAAARAARMKVVGITNSFPREKLGLAHRVIDSLVGASPDDHLDLFTP